MENAEDEDDPVLLPVLFSQVPDAGDGPRDPQPTRRFDPSITDETDPCNRMEEQHAGLQAALGPDWRGGVTCRVVQGGEVTLGDQVRIVEEPA